MKYFDVTVIKKSKLPCYFVSPHLDDAILSAGSLMKHLSQFTRVTVINIFTAPSQLPLSQSIRAMLHRSQYETSSDLYRARIKEDRKALTRIGVHALYLDYPEALFRPIKKLGVLRRLLSSLLPEFLYVYPTFRFHVASGRIADWDKDLIDKIAADLRRIIKQPAIVFCPMAIGKHVDHIVVRRATESICKPYVWADQPYLIRNPKEIPDLQDYFSQWQVDQNDKKSVVAEYRSQIPGLFDNKHIPDLDEYFRFAG